MPNVTCSTPRDHGRPTPAPVVVVDSQASPDFDALAVVVVDEAADLFARSAAADPMSCPECFCSLRAYVLGQCSHSCCDPGTPEAWDAYLVALIAAGRGVNIAVTVTP